MAQTFDTPIEKEMQSSYLDYAMSVIIGRALPDARDGLKPAQRRILYSMYKLSNFSDQPTKKSARVVGDCIGKYHPHGDIAVYETLVRLAQDFSMNHTLVQGQGNMGSIDGDPPAAQRYTEVRLNKLAEEMLSDIEKKPVPFVPNFDNTEEEPLILPAKVPNLLLNGAAGIAVGVATNIMPHNLNEIADGVIAYIDDPNISIQKLLEYIKGPDFPTGGIIFYDGGLINSYLTGRGAVTVRGKTNIEKHNNRQSIVITEIPYALNKSLLVQKIAELVKDKTLTEIADLRDESGKEGIRIVVDLKADANPDQVLNMLYAHTQLQQSIHISNIAVIGNKLVTLNLKEFIKVFVQHRLEVIKKRVEYDFNVASDRLHIVEGLLVAMLNIEGVIELIKKSSDSKEARVSLVSKYGISEKQANAILDMKLGRLTSLESTALNTEKLQLQQSITSFKEILADEKKVYGIIKEDMTELKAKFGRERRTQIEEGTNVEPIEQEDLISDDDATVILTRNNYVKRMPIEVYKLQSRGGKGVITMGLKENDYPKSLISCKLKDYLLVISTLGRLYWLKAYLVPEAQRYGAGKAIVNLVKLQEGEGVSVIVNTRNFSKSYLVFITKKGKIKKVMAERFSNPRSNGVRAIPLLQGDELADVALAEISSEIFVATKAGKALRFSEARLRPMGRNAVGVRGIRLAQDDEVVNIISARHDDLVVSITDKGFGKATRLDEYRLQNRGGKGVINVKLKEKTGNVIKAVKASEKDNIILINSNGVSIMFPISSVRITGRSASGVHLMRLDAATKVVDARVLQEQQ
jgi:DNA gyrase subunit A